MAGRLPRFMVMKSPEDSLYARRDVENGTNIVGMGNEESGVFSTGVKIEVEPSTVNDRYVHLRFCSSNRYWQLDRDNSLVEYWPVVAKATKPVEDTTDEGCTLFEPTIVDSVSSLFYLTHVNTGRIVIPDPLDLYNFHAAPGDYKEVSVAYLRFVNWEALVKLPSHVAFKGYNGSYLKGIWADNHQYLQFAVEDPNQEIAGHRIFLMPDGNVRIKSDHFDRYWQYEHDWIYASSTDPSGESNSTLFTPVKLDDNTIALRCVANKKFCKSHTYDGFTDCLNAAVEIIVNETKMSVQELVLNRKIYNVRYRMEDARIYGETPILLGTTTGTNKSDQENQIGVEIKYEDSKTHSFSHSTSVTAGVKATIEAGIPLIGETKIEIGFQVNEAFEWGNSETTTTSVTTSDSVSVPGRSVATVNYVATVGACDIPYSYTQSEQSSTTGEIIEVDYDDGLFTGVNYYNFNFVVEKITPLDLASPN